MPNQEGSAAVSDKQTIIYQGFLAFGHGADGLRIPRTTCAVMHQYFHAFFDEEYGAQRIADWESTEIGPQVLERAEVIGRLAANNAVDRGSTTIDPKDFQDAAKIVHDPNAETRWCGETAYPFQ